MKEQEFLKSVADISDELIILPIVTINKILKLDNKNKGDAISLYTFYYYTAKWQKTNQPKAVDIYVRNGLKLGKERLLKAQKILLDLNLIERIVKKDSNGKIKGWYIKLNYIIKKDIINNIFNKNQLPGNPLVGKPTSGKTHQVEKPTSGKTEINALSTSNINALSTSKKEYRPPKKEVSKNIVKNSLLGEKNLNFYKTHSAIINIIKNMIKVGGFSHKLPKDNKIPTKLILRCIEYLKSIKMGTFLNEIRLEKEWSNKFIKKTPNKGGYESWREVKEIVLRSLSNYVQDVQNSKNVGGNLWFPKEMTQFFFNSVGSTPGKSMFLKYYNIQPKRSKEYISNWLEIKISDESRKYLQPVLDSANRNYSENDLLQFWGNMNQLLSWWNKNNNRLKIYNQAYHDNGWGYHCSTPDNFFYMVSKYLVEGMGSRFPIRPIPLDKHNSYWRAFRFYMLNSFNIELDVDDEKEKKAEEEIKKIKKQSYESLVNEEIEKIKIERREYGLDPLSLEEIEKIAKRRIDILK